MTEKHLDFLIASFFICLYLLLTSPRRPTRTRSTHVYRTDS